LLIGYVVDIMIVTGFDLPLSGAFLRKLLLHLRTGGVSSSWSLNELKMRRRGRDAVSTFAAGFPGSGAALISDWFDCAPRGVNYLH
jgi:hypothetical protein